MSDRKTRLCQFTAIAAVSTVAIVGCRLTQANGSPQTFVPDSEEKSYAMGVPSGKRPPRNTSGVDGVLPPASTDYTLLFWKGAWRNHSPKEPRTLCILTGKYGLAFDPERIELNALGPVKKSVSYDAASRAGFATVSGLAPAKLDIRVRLGGAKGKVFRCIGGAFNQQDFENFPIRVLDSGRLLQKIDVLGLEFRDDDGVRLRAQGRLEIIAWSDRVSFLMEITPEVDLPTGTEMTVAVNGSKDGKTVTSNGSWTVGETRRAGATWPPDASPDEPKGIKVEANALSGSPTGPAALSPTFDKDRGGYHIALPTAEWSEQEEKENDRLERVALTIRNTSDQVKTVRLCFDRDKTVGGLTGVSPMLRDSDGNPTGIPVQVSKNWPKAIERVLPGYGPWLHEYATIRIRPNSTANLELTTAFAHWGGVPAASHAQLSLVGWGGNQLWDEAALGSWGESICYDPWSALGEPMITDVRPLMVWVNGRQRQKWFWTNNVGGGDFLVYHDASGKRQYLAQNTAQYRAIGPNLTDVVYSGVTEDGAISARISLSTPRSNDINRSFHRIRYDVLKPTPFARLAFYQVGADLYNPHQFNKMAIGNKAGMLQEWSVPKGGKTYDRTGIACVGEVPWVSLHEAVNQDTKGGSWANRGLVIRHWKARLGGKDVATPFLSTFGTEHVVPSRNVELSPPPGVKELKVGDFVEAELELVIVPQSADDYYGPNADLKTALTAGGNTWKPILREAAGNDVVVQATKGTINRNRLPLAVAVDATSQSADIRIQGGLAYIPITFTGLFGYRGYALFKTDASGKEVEINQSVHGNDFWQTNYDPASRTWSRTYNVDTDTPGNNRPTVRLVLRRKMMK